MKILAGILGLLLFVFIVLTIVLGIVLVNNNSKIAQLEKTISDLQMEDENPDDEDETPTPTIETKHFVDTGLDIDVAYPEDWEYELATQVDEEFAENGFRTISTYTLTLSKADGEIVFSTLFGATGDMGVGYSKEEYDTEVLNDDVIRVKQHGTDTWKYLYNVDCDDVLDLQPGVTVCGSGGFFPGFAGGASTASFSGDEDLLDEADAIILSATL